MSKPERSEPPAPAVGLPVEQRVGRLITDRADSAVDWPCARLCVGDNGDVTATMYATHGLPPGNHDVWSSPVESAECARWKRAIGAVLPDDFKSWHENSDAELPSVAAWAITNLRTRLDEWEQACDLMVDLLNRTAIALRSLGWEDLPDRAAAAAASIDVERMIAECVPGGSICDPQQVADAIRRYFNAKRAPPEIEPPRAAGAWR